MPIANNETNYDALEKLKGVRSRLQDAVANNQLKVPLTESQEASGSNAKLDKPKDLCLGDSLALQAKCFTGQSFAGDAANPKERFYMDAMSNAGSSELRKVKVVVMDGKVVLQGTVSSYYQKQLAQETIRPLVIGAQIVNEITVEH